MTLIDGVKVKDLKKHADERGYVMELLRSDETLFSHFGQTYVTTANPGVVKGWHYHKKQTDYFACLHGMVKLVLFDDREGSKTCGMVNEFFLGDNNPQMVLIPPFIYHGFKGISEFPSLMINIPTHPYMHADPDEYRLPAHTEKIPYSWERKDR